MQHRTVSTPKKRMPWARIRVSAETVQLVFVAVVAVVATTGRKRKEKKGEKNRGGGRGAGVTTFKQRNSSKQFTVPRSPLFLSPRLEEKEKKKKRKKKGGGGRGGGGYHF